ncbi:hypothetical protein ACX8Z9_04615 [Arthrobacter halodurans]|uniref:HNH endonuclease n=1 Tax=Arthrobacter halodurans TaxID=516699 RepID=A0ABV4USL3_9MICC
MPSITTDKNNVPHSAENGQFTAQVLATPTAGLPAPAGADWMAEGSGDGDTPAHLAVRVLDTERTEEDRFEALRGLLKATGELGQWNQDNGDEGGPDEEAVADAIANDPEKLTAALDAATEHLEKNRDNDLAEAAGSVAEEVIFAPHGGVDCTFRQDPAGSGCAVGAGGYASPMTAYADPRSHALEASIAALDPKLFTRWPGGWRGNVELALLDAVFSIRATHRAKTPGKGVAGRVLEYRAWRGGVADDLGFLAGLDEDTVKGFMGQTVTSGRTKASAAIEAAGRFHAAGLGTTKTLDPSDRDHLRHYTDVHGLGWVTRDYFGMNLGHPGSKVDVHILAFAREATGTDRLDPEDVRAMLREVHAARPDLGATETHMDHAIWLSRHPEL